MTDTTYGRDTMGDNLSGERASDDLLAEQGRPLPTSVIVAFLVLLNGVAMWGQSQWFYEHITNHNGFEDWIPAIGVSLVIELIGVYLAGMAHAALMANQSALSLLLGAYGIGFVMGGLNYSHFGGRWDSPNAAAVTFGLLSSISPWLWRIYSRHMHRRQLEMLGQLDKRGVRLGGSRKFWHPWKSVQVMSYAAWEGITEPSEAVRAWSHRNDPKPTVPDSPEALQGLPEAPVSPAPAVRRSPAEWVALAEAEMAKNPAASWGDVANAIGCSDRYLRTCRKAVAQ